MKLVASVLLVSAAVVLSTPTPTLQKRAELCEQWDSVETGSYIVYNNLWGMESATGGQCTEVDSLDESSLAWHTSYNWTDNTGNQAISYANAVLLTDPVQISSISSIPSTWSWSYDGSDLVANVAYDLFTSSTADNSEEYEIMIWLAALGGAGPISSTGSPVATVTVSEISWDLYDGDNGNMHVFSFVANSNVESFNGDLKEFVDYLTSEQGLPASQYVINSGAGTEPFTGTNALFTTSAYSIEIQ